MMDVATDDAPPRLGIHSRHLISTNLSFGAPQMEHLSGRTPISTFPQNGQTTKTASGKEVPNPFGLSQEQIYFALAGHPDAADSAEVAGEVAVPAMRR